MNYTLSSSILSRKESSNLKGLLILLVVFGHNSLAMEYTGLYSFLYSFHVYAFYILPFLYGAEALDKSHERNISILIKRSWKNFKYFYMLFILWTTISLIMIMVRGASFPGLLAIVKGYIFNSSLRETFGVGFLWFIPTMVSVLFWRDIYFYLNKCGRISVFLLGVVLWSLSIAGIVDYRNLGHLLPFSIIFGLFFAVQGIAVRWILIHIMNKSWCKWISLLLLMINYHFLKIRDNLPEGCVYITWSVLPVIAFCSLYPWRMIIEKICFLNFLGRYSFSIYLIHVYVYNIYLHIVPWHHPINAIISFIVTIIITTVSILLLKYIHNGWLIGIRKKYDQ